MAKTDKYRDIVRKLIGKYSDGRYSSEETERQIISDTEHDHYQLLNVGWHNNRRVYNCVMHIDIKNSKIWIQQNNTEIEIADELVSMGVPKADIVLGFHSPYKRQFTEFAVA